MSNSKKPKWERDEDGKRVKRTLGIRRFKIGYEVHAIEYSNAQYGGKGTLIMKEALTPHGCYVGNTKWAHRLYNRFGMSKVQPADKEDNVCSIGFCASERKWYGWSHRAMCGFSIGDMLFKERMKGATDKTPFVKHGTVRIKTLGQAKLAARRFANYVS